MDKTLLPDDLKKLKELLLQQNRQLTDQKIQLAEQNSVIVDKSAAIEELSEQVRLLKAIAFAKKLEMAIKLAKEEYQYSLFDEAEFVCEPPSLEPDPEIVQVPAHACAKKGRKPISEFIPREEIIDHISDEEKICACGCELSRIGEVVREKLDYEPAKILGLHHIRPKYACKKCEGSRG